MFIKEDGSTVDPLNADTFGIVLKCPDYQGVISLSPHLELPVLHKG